jgi:cytochrome c553
VKRRSVARDSFPKALIAFALAAATQVVVAAQATTVPDTIAQRVVACTSCHGKEGRGTTEGYFPRIAGKPAGYLYNQLLNFRDGRRDYGMMTYLVEHLTDDYLAEISRYFATIDLPYAPPPATNVSPAQLKDGEAFVRNGDRKRNIPACTQCHGVMLTGVSPSIPGLLGLPRDYLLAQLGHWKTGERRAQAPDCMARIAAELTAQEVALITGWLAAQPVPANPRPVAALDAPLPMRCAGMPG